MNPKSGSVNYKIETDLKRSLDRLEGMLAQKKVSIKELGTIVPAFYYSVRSRLCRQNFCWSIQRASSRLIKTISPNSRN